MNRRDFLLLRTDRAGRSVELSCEQLYMRYVDSRLDGTTAELFERLDRDLRMVDVLRVVESTWLAHEDLKQQLDPLLASLRARGVRVELSRTASITS